MRCAGPRSGKFLLQASRVCALHHRVENTLAAVQAIPNATVRSAVSMSAFTRPFTDRIVSLALTRALISEGETQVASEGLLRAELPQYNQDGRFMLQGPAQALPSELAVPVSAALHERTANALRHGALAQPGGRVTATGSAEGELGERHLRWLRNEPDGSPTLPAREGFGTRLPIKVPTAQAAAEVDVASDADGRRVDDRVPPGSP